MDFNLYTFGNELFQNSSMELSFHQWNSSCQEVSEEKKEKAEGININNRSLLSICSIESIWIDQPFDIFVKILPPSNYNGTAEQFRGAWMTALKSIQVEYKLLSQGVQIPCYVKEAEENSAYTPMTNIYNKDKIMDKLLFYSFSEEDLSIVFIYSTIISTEYQYLNDLLSFEFNMEVMLPQDLPFNKLLITDPQELRIRMLLDTNRHSARACPTHSISCGIRLIQPIALTLTCHELDELHSLLVITVKNQSSRCISMSSLPRHDHDQDKHPAIPFQINEIYMHSQQTFIDLEKILEIFPNNNKYYCDTDGMSAAGFPTGVTGPSTTNNLNSNTNYGVNGNENNSFTEVSMQDSTQQYYINNILTSLSQHNHLCQMFSIQPIQYQQNCLIPCNEEICFIYQVEINQEIMKKWNSEASYLPFGYFKTPISLYWTPDPTKTSSSSSSSSSCNHSLPQDNDCHTVLLNLMLPWSIGTTTSSCLPQNLSFLAARNSPPPAGVSGETTAAPFPPKSSAFDKIIENGFLSIPPFITAIRPTVSLLHLDIEGPHSVKVNEPFSLRLHISNISSYPMNEVVVHTQSSKPSNPSDSFNSTISSFVFKVKQLSLGTLPPRSSVVKEVILVPFAPGPQIIDELTVSCLIPQIPKEGLVGDERENREVLFPYGRSSVRRSFEMLLSYEFFVTS